MPNTPTILRSITSRYGLAVVAVLIATALRFSIDLWVPQEVPFLFFFFAVMFAAWSGGLGPGLLASFLSLLLADFFFIGPLYQFEIDSLYAVSLTAFCLETVAISILAEKSKRTEAALREKEAHFRAAFQWASVGKVHLEESSGRFLEVNQAFCRMTGYQRDELLHMTTEDITHLEDRSLQSIGTAGHLKEEPNQYNLEKRFIRKDGSIIWVQIEGALLPNASDQPKRTIAVILDITKRKTAEEALLESNRRFQAVFEQSITGIAQVDLSGRFLLMNNRFCEIVGRSREKLLTLRMQDITHPDDLPPNMKNFAALVDGRKPGFIIEKRYVRPDNNVVWVRNEVSAIRDAGGDVRYITAVVSDITLDKKAEEIARRRTAQFETLVNQAPFGIYLLDADLRIIQVNPVARPVFGDIPDLVGRAFREVMSLLWEPRYADEIFTIFRHTLQSGENFSISEKAEVRSDRGVTEYYEWRVDRITLLDGRYGLVCYFKDISAQVLARQAIAEGAQALQRLNAELENRVDERTQELLLSQKRLRALAAELNLAEQRERKRLAEALHDHLQQILVLGKLKIGQSQRLVQAFPACANLLTQVDDLFSEALNWTRSLVTELSPPVLREHGLAAGLQWLANYMQKHDMTIGVKILNGENVRLPEDQSLLLFQSVRELLINASKHADTGQATVTLDHRDDLLHITVSDHGKGFDHDAVFADLPADGAPSEGLKFGLFSIRERMKALGGSFGLVTAPGKGTTCVLTLPLNMAIEQSTELPNQVSELPGQQTDFSKPHIFPVTAAEGPHRTVVPILLVDDHAMVRQGLRAILESYADVQVVGEACNGQEAVELTEQLKPSVVVMDINMPVMNGIEATTKIKSRHPHIVVIGMSVNADDDNQNAMKMAGASILLTKEAAVEQLHTSIQKFPKAMV